MLNITFTKETLGEIFNFLGDGFDRGALVLNDLPPTVLLDESCLADIIARMTAVAALENEETDKIKAALRTLIFRLITEHFSGYQKKSVSAPLWLTALCLELEKPQNFTRGDICVYELCEKSREHISRSMKRYLGVTVSEYINGIRLNYISNMLIHSNQNILDIVLESGFNNLSWASKCFTERYGCTMSEYRKNNG